LYAVLAKGALPRVNCFDDSLGGNPFCHGENFNTPHRAGSPLLSGASADVKQR
jgi:hypothetical protein